MEEIVNYFQRLGLTQYESAALAALVSHHNSDAQQIAEMAEIPYTKIYGVLTSLEKQGFLKTTLERPKKYQPISPESIVNILLQKRTQEFKYLQKKSDEGLKFIQKVYVQGEQFTQNNSVIYLPTKEAVWDMMHQFTRKAKDAIMGLAGINTSQLYLEDINQSKYSLDFCNRGGKARVIWPSSIDFPSLLAKASIKHAQFFLHPNVKFRFSDKYKIHPDCMIIDNKEVCIAFLDPKSGNITSGLVLKDPLVVKGYVDYYNLLWDNSQSISNLFFEQISQKINPKVKSQK